MNLWLLRLLIRGRDASELLDLTRASLLVEALGVALLALLDRGVDEDFDEGEGGRVLGVESAGEVAVCGVGGDEGGDGEGGRGGEEEGDLRVRKG